MTLPDGKPFELDNTHPTFDELCEALLNKEWASISQLINEAENIAWVTEGLVKVTKLGVTYNGEAVHSSLTTRIMDMAKAGKDINYLLKFMDNLQQNPSQHAKERFYDWLQDNDLPITDDGCCLAYKYLDDNYKDTHTHRIDNSPGQIIMMDRAATVDDYSVQCATGFHICSKMYGTYGTKAVAVKFNPRHILSAVGGKMRVTKYEVLCKLGDKTAEYFTKDGYSALEKTLVIEVKQQRRELITLLLNHKVIQNLINRKKIKKTTIMRYPFGKLKRLADNYHVVPRLGPEDPEFLQNARKAANIGTIELAKKIGIKPLQLKKIEANPKPTDAEVNQVLNGIAKLTGRKEVSYPIPVAEVAP